MPDDLRWSWGSDASAGERLQIQIIISREVWPHRDHNKSLADSNQNPISEWQVKTSSGLPLSLHYGELYNYFIIHYNVIIIKCTINVMAWIILKPSPLSPGLWKNCLPWNWSLALKWLGTAGVECCVRCTPHHWLVALSDFLPATPSIPAVYKWELWFGIAGNQIMGGILSYQCKILWFPMYKQLKSVLSHSCLPLSNSWDHCLAQYLCNSYTLPLLPILGALSQGLSFSYPGQ